MTEPSPRPRVLVTESWRCAHCLEPGTRQRIEALTEAERRVSAENVELLKDLTELQRRVGYAQWVCRLRECDLLPRRILRILAGEERRTGEGVANHVRGAGVDADPQVGGGAAAVGGEAVAGGGAASVYTRGEVGVSGPVGAVAAWPYVGADDA